MQKLYTIALYLFYPLIWLYLRYCYRHFPEYINAMSQLRGRIKFQSDGRDVLWFHAASVGEVVQAAMLVQATLTDGKRLVDQFQIILTTNTPTGAIQCKKLLGNSVKHLFAPLDYPYFVNRFIRKIKPKKIILIERELWPNWLRVCGQNKIKIILANARLTDKTLAQYRKWRWLRNSILRNVDMILPQSQTDKLNFSRLGFEQHRLCECGNVKYAMQLSTNNQLKIQKLQNGLSYSHSHYWVAGSVHPHEVELCLQSYLQLQKQYDDICLVLAPRHPDKFQHAIEKSKQLGLKTQLFSVSPIIAADADVMIIDEMGELLPYYAIADICLVGGTFEESIGGHNILEPAYFAKPIIIGPYGKNIQSLIDVFLKEQALCQIQKHINKHDTFNQSLCELMGKLFAQPELCEKMGSSAKAILESHAHAAQQQAELIAK